MEREASAIRLHVLVALALAAPIALALAAAPGALAANCGRTSTGLPALTDLGAGSYLGHEGGLYPGGANERPAAWSAIGESLAAATVPRDGLGLPAPATGKIVFLSIGMSNTRNEFSRFVALANADPLRHARVQVVNGAIGGQTASEISDPASPYWNAVDDLLAGAGATPKQVGAIWLKEANAGPSGDPFAHAESLESDLAAITQILTVRFPNAHLAYLSSRIYAGYASTALNPEPYAHASAWSVKGLVESAIDGTLPVEHVGRASVAPWLSWGPYTWADGLAARGDGLTWACSEFAADGTHPNAAGSEKVARMLLDLVHEDATARAWYVDGGALG